MPLPQTLNSYADVKRVADSVIANGCGASLTFDSSAQATRWRQRFYQFRKLLLRDRQSTPYDSLLLRKEMHSPIVRIEFLEQSGAKVVFDNPEAQLLPSSESASAVRVDLDDPLLLQALAFVPKVPE